MPSLSVSTGLAPLAPFSIASEILSPSESTSNGLGRPSLSVSGGVIPPLADEGTPLASTPPSAFPSLLASMTPASLVSFIPSLSESAS